MHKTSHELRVGDRIRIVRLPSAWDRPAYLVPPCTRRLYRRLIARGRPVRVYEIDRQGLPWIHCRFRRPDGRWEHHFLAIDAGSWVRVRKRGS